jgi:hypothetical protein
MRKLTFSDKYLIPWLTLLAGLAISVVAVWYSVAGLVAIFAASATAIIIMGVVLEVGKLVTAVYLHRYWNVTVGWLKTYLSIAVIFLMFITSMGIFGFLSKAHVEQTSLSQEQSAQVEVIDEKIIRSDAKITRWQDEIDRLLKTGNVSTDTALLGQDTEQLKELRIQIKSEKDIVRNEADKRIKTAQERRDKEIEAAKPLLEDWGGEEKYNKEVLKAKQTEQNESSVARSTRDKKIKDIDKKYSKELAQVNKRINEARKGSTTKAGQADKRIKELEKNIEAEQLAIEVVRQDKLVYEKEYRKLEAEVGPIKYIAEFVYGTTDKSILEKAVTWVIILIIFVFDPLAVGMLIASQYAFLLSRGEGLKPLDTKEDSLSVLKKDGKTKVIERVIEVEADVDDTTPKDIEQLEKEVEQKKEK